MQNFRNKHHNSTYKYRSVSFESKVIYFTLKSSSTFVLCTSISRIDNGWNRLLFWLIFVQKRITNEVRLNPCDWVKAFYKFFSWNFIDERTIALFWLAFLGIDLGFRCWFWRTLTPSTWNLSDYHHFLTLVSTPSCADMKIIYTPKPPSQKWCVPFYCVLWNNFIH
jgi:hypothetical protein